MLSFLINQFSSYQIKSLPDIFSKADTIKIGDIGLWCKPSLKYLKSDEFKHASEDILLNIFLDKRIDYLPLSAVSRSIDGSKVLKLEFIKHFRKRNSLDQEAEIIRFLSSKGCISIPNLLDHGKLKINQLLDFLPSSDFDLLEKLDINEISFMIIDYVPTEAKIPFPDLIFSLIEQKSFGIYHGDLKPANLRFDIKKGVCVFIDFDQALYLASNVMAINPLEFIKWCDLHDSEAYGSYFGNCLRHFFGFFRPLHLNLLFRKGAFNLAKTTPYKRQSTTNTKNGVYHTITSKDIFADGVRDLKDRSLLLEVVEFARGETVLDVGCNAGLLCHYLAGRGCLPTGIELDQSIVVAAKMISNVLGVDSNFHAIDLDVDPIPGVFDTICLFSVIHHTKNLSDNGIKIANACNRILIECRLHEKGRKPIMKNGKILWESTSVWDYKEEEDLFKGLMNLFPNFQALRKVGNADKDRILIEMVKR
ncbi:Methyltransferase domain containing protein [Candidatus Methylopumilus universalis]|uniref:methyltransferase domain-containing protein n=1 Tax=Candidatus Methylopumilus universalis TaxID=2588536 RepID=UPI003BEED75B